SCATGLLHHTVLLKFDSSIRPGGMRLCAFVYAIGRRRIAVNQHTAQMYEALDFIFPTCRQKVAQPSCCCMRIAEGTIHHVRTSAECHLELLLVKKIHGRQVDAQSSETHGIPAIVNERDNFSFALFEQ